MHQKARRQAAPQAEITALWCLPSAARQSSPGFGSERCTHLEAASSPKGSFPPGTDWLTAMGNGFPATTAKEKENT